MVRKAFDQDYYDRFYMRPAARIGTRESTARLVRFVASYLAHLEVEVKSVLDLGCGLGWWQEPVKNEFGSRTRWTGVERSEHAARTHGWQLGSVVDWAGEPNDLVVCQGVLQYLSRRDCDQALRNLRRLAKSALYLEVVTEEDWEETLDREKSDGEIAKRPAEYYRAALRKEFASCGGGLFVRRDACVLFALEEGRER